MLLQLPGLLDVVERVRAPGGGERSHIALSSFGSQSLIERRHCKTTECLMSLQISRVLHCEDFEKEIRRMHKMGFGFYCLSAHAVQIVAWPKQFWQRRSRVNGVELNENIYERGLLSLGPSTVQAGRPCQMERCSGWQIKLWH